MEVLRELAPAAAAIGVLVNPNNPNAEFDNMKPPWRRRGRSDGKCLSLTLPANGTSTQRSRLSSSREPPPCWRHLTTFTSRPNQLAALAARYALPAIYARRGLPQRAA